LIHRLLGDDLLKEREEVLAVQVVGDEVPGLRDAEVDVDVATAREEQLRHRGDDPVEVLHQLSPLLEVVRACEFSDTLVEVGAENTVPRLLATTSRSTLTAGIVALSGSNRHVRIRCHLSVRVS
jgi:hypothetical protein